MNHRGGIKLYELKYLINKQSVEQVSVATAASPAGIKLQLGPRRPRRICFPSAVTMSRARPVAFRLMTALASAVIVSGLIEECGGSIGFAPFRLDVAENFSQFHTI